MNLQVSFLLLWCQLELNQRRKDFQSFALPAELWHREQGRKNNKLPITATTIFN